MAFSVSHARELTVIALTRAYAAIGIDIEGLGRACEMRLPTRVLSSAERKTLARVPPGRREEVFLRYWTAKEAYVKGLGCGLSLELETIEVKSLGSDDVALSVGGWALSYFRPAPGVIGALVVQSAEGRPAGEESYRDAPCRLSAKGTG